MVNVIHVVFEELEEKISAEKTAGRRILALTPFKLTYSRISKTYEAREYILVTQ